VINLGKLVAEVKSLTALGVVNAGGKRSSNNNKKKRE
jgi:hypothetical protein